MPGTSLVFLALAKWRGGVKRHNDVMPPLVAGFADAFKTAAASFLSTALTVSLLLTPPAADAETVLR